ncbi:MAG: peptidylprolyl isomerase [Balneolaceae bacterium]|nr:MAG: peptidylprolyl isomerase [Balneolaceae bacterium]
MISSVLKERGAAGGAEDAGPPRKPFRYPESDWETDTDRHYDWVLETSQGEIRIRLDPDSAPFTVSSILHLSETGQYDGVVFHRVVRNFVIQGGDFDRRDGFGGPPYRIPTEPSFSSFNRGSVGMASSGQDTEGSQFFITHTRTPHLDGLYTLFGEVVEGMEVVDRIRLGDVVISARVEVREGRGK